MEPEDIVEIIRSAVARKFGEDRIKDITYFGPCEGEDLNVIISVEGIDERKDTIDLWRELRNKFDDLDLDVPFRIVRA